jgi:hypothetical protein
MARHFVMDHSGHSTVEFDPRNTVELSAAMERFKALTGDGFTAAVRKEGERDYKVTRTFDPSADTETLFVPAMQGG